MSLSELVRKQIIKEGPQHAGGEDAADLWATSVLNDMLPAELLDRISDAFASITSAEPKG